MQISQNKNQGTVLITGASGKIGSYLALLLAQYGFDILACFNKSAKKAASLQEEILNIGLLLG